MDQLVRQYAVDHFPPTMLDIINDTFSIFDSFELLGYNDDFVNLLMQQEYMSPVDVSDAYMALLINKQNYILEQHKIVLVQEATLEQRNELLRGLHLLLDLYDYTPVINILESFAIDEEKLTAILALVCNLDDSTIFSLLESVASETITTLRDYVYKKLKDDSQPIIHGNIKNIKLFRNYIGHSEYLAKKMVESNIPMGLCIGAYLPVIANALQNKTIEELAIDVYSVLMMTNSKDSPVMQFKNCSQSMFSDIKTISDVGASLIKIDLAFNKYILETTHEKN